MSADDGIAAPIEEDPGYFIHPKVRGPSVERLVVDLPLSTAHSLHVLAAQANLQPSEVATAILYRVVRGIQ